MQPAAQARSLNIECEAIIDIICISFIILAWSIANIVKLYLVMLEMLFVTKHVQQRKKQIQATHKFTPSIFFWQKISHSFNVIFVFFVKKPQELNRHEMPRVPVTWCFFYWKVELQVNVVCWHHVFWNNIETISLAEKPILMMSEWQNNN